LKPKGTRKSPLENPPLRNPGQSLDEELQRIIGDSLVPYFMVPSMLAAFALIELMRYFRPLPPSPWLAAAAAILAIIFSGYKVHQLRSKICAYRLGRDGEKVVGQSLEKLRGDGAIVLHDITSNGFNVDHVVISTNGIFVIETKTRSKPNGRRGTIKYDGDTVLVDGKVPDRDPIQQVKAISSWVQELIWESTGKSFQVKPVVLFPGWYVDTINPAAHKKVWVLNPKNLPSFMQHEKGGISPEDVNLIAYHLSRYIRAEGSNR
jgi:hypothetical protein